MRVLITALVTIPQDDSSGCNDDSLLTAVAEGISQHCVKRGAQVEVLTASATGGRTGMLIAGKVVGGAFVIAQ